MSVAPCPSLSTGPILAKPRPRGLPPQVKRGGFVNDKLAARFEVIHHRTIDRSARFLKTGVVPEIGQRVELSLILVDGGPCRLSGKVIDIFPEPSLRPMRDPYDKNGSMRLNRVLGIEFGDEKGFELDEISAETVKTATNLCRSTLGAVHGQRIVCEARLNYDFAPYPGGPRRPIPFDVEDVWRFELVANDHKVNMWCVDDESFVNLGPVRPTRWPWSNSFET